MNCADCWEDRMAAKAAARRREREAQSRADEQAEEAQWHRDHDAEVDAFVDALAALMGPEPHVDFACACIGSPFQPYGPCMCQLRQMARARRQ